MQRIFLDRWICVGRESEVAAAGDYFLAQVFNESVIVTRDRSGHLRAHYNVCRHRGARIVQSERGNASAFRCPYHGWSYDAAGMLTAAPFTQEVQSFDRSCYSLHPVAIESWEGFVFLNLSADPEPFPEAFGPVMGRFAPWDLPRLAIARSIEYDIQANWKLIVENYSECYHCPFIHEEFSRRCAYRSGYNDLSEGPFLGGYMALTPGSQSLTRSGQLCGPPIGSVTGEDLRRVYFYALFPNMTLSLHPDYVMSFVLHPLAPGRSKLTCSWLFPEAALAAGECNANDAVRFWDNVNQEDWNVCSLVQEGVASRSYRPSPFLATESLLPPFTREVLKALDARPSSG